MIIWSGFGGLFLVAWVAAFFALILTFLSPPMALLVVALANGAVTLRPDADPRYGSLFFIPVKYWTIIIGGYAVWVLVTGKQISNFI